MVTFYIGDLLTGDRIQIIPDVLSGSWAETLNRADSLSCTVTLKDPVIRRLGLAESATPGKAFLAAVDGTTVLAAGPIWDHQYDDNSQRLTLTAAGMWSYFDHRVLLPVLEGRLPSDSTTDTRYMPADPDGDYPWPTDTRKSLQGIVRALVEQARSWTGGQVPVILPDEIAGTNERAYKGSDLAAVGEELRRLTRVIGGPDVKFVPRFKSDMSGVEWVLQIGTPTEPLIFGAIDPVFNASVAKSTVSNLRVGVDGTGLASQVFAAGGRTDDVALVSQSNDESLPDAGFPLLERVDSSHSSVSVGATLQGYSDELVVVGRRPVQSWSFDHDTSKTPFLSGFAAGDFARVRVRGNAYLADGTYRLRILSRSGDETTRKVSLTFQPATGDYFTPDAFVRPAAEGGALPSESLFPDVSLFPGGS